MLHPLQEVGSEKPNFQKDDTPEDLLRQQILTLHFDFEMKPTGEQIKLFAEQINEMFGSNAVPANGVHWGTMQSRQSIVWKAATPFINNLSQIHRRSISQRHLAPIDTSRGDGQSSPDDLALTTPWSTSPKSPRLSVSVDSTYTVINVPSLSPMRITNSSESNGESEPPTKKRVRPN